jgi:hypothetical protein
MRIGDESCCKDCPERIVTEDYNCHMHCQRYIKKRIKDELRYRKVMRYKDQNNFMYEMKSVIRKKEMQKQRAKKGKANEK